MPGATDTATPPRLSRLPAGRSPGGPPRRGLLVLAVIAGALLLALASLAVLPTTLAFDAEAWTIWGRELAGGTLNTEAIPSWKPGPVLFTTPFALLDLPVQAAWLVVARAGALLALAGAAALAHRLGGALAAVVAPGLLGFSPWLFFNSALGNSEGLLAAAILWAAVAHVSGRHRLALALGVGAALLRPETWPFLGLYALWQWRRGLDSVRVPAAALALVALLWVVPDRVGAGEFLHSSSIATSGGSPGSASRAEIPALEAWVQALELITLPVALAALAGALTGGRGARWLAVGALGWVSIVAVMAQGGYSGQARYSAAAAAVACVLAGVGVARGPRAAAHWLGRGLRTGVADSHGGGVHGSGATGRGLETGVADTDGAKVRGPQAAARAPRTGATDSGGGAFGSTAAASRGPLARDARPSHRTVAALAVAIGAALVGWVAVTRADEAVATARTLDGRATVRRNLDGIIARNGGPAAVRSCGTVATHGPLQAAVAWRTGRPIVSTPPLPRPPGALLRTRDTFGRPAPALTTTELERYRVVDRYRGWELRATCRIASPGRAP